MRRSLVFAGKDFREFSCWWDGSKVFRKPSKKVDSYGIPFRNGDLFRSQMAFNNVQIVFNCYIKTDFEKNYTNLVNYLHSFDTYQKLETTSESDVYRMAHIHEEIEPTTGQFLKDGQFSLVFDCMPQEFLKIGDDEITVQNQTPVYSGKSLQIENSGQSTVSMARVYFSPKQDLNGYEYPWVGGTGKNFLPSHAVGSTTTNGVTFTANANGTITVNGTATAEAQYAITISNLTGNYYFSGCPSGGSNTTYELYAWDYTASARFKKWNGTTASDSDFGTGNNEINIPSGHNGELSIRIRNGYTANNLVFKPMIRLASVTDATYEPYENFCPITGWSGVFLFRPSGKNWLEYKGDLFPSEVDGVTFTPNAETKQITIDGTSTAEIEYMLNEEVPLAEGTYIMTGTPSFKINNARLVMRIGEVLYDDFGEGCEFTLTEPKTASVYIYVPSDYTPLNETFSPMIRLADTDPTYEPYKEGGTVWESFLSTRYGGYVDLQSGTLTVTHKLLEFDGVTTGKKVASKGSGNENNYYLGLSDGSAYGMTSAGFVNRDTLLSYGYWCSDLRIGSSSGSRTFPYMSAYVNASSVFQPRIFFGTESDVTTVALANAWLADLYNAGKPLQIVYSLKEPQTIQLTANEIALLYGTNTFSTDADSITIRTVEPMQITNPTLMDAKPLIKINNGGSYYIDGELIIQTHGSGATYPMYIDTETMDAYAINEYGGKVSMNGYVDLTAGFILIGKGTHDLFSNNANNAWAIVPRWWRL